MLLFCLSMIHIREPWLTLQHPLTLFRLSCREASARPSKSIAFDPLNSYFGNLTSLVRTWQGKLKTLEVTSISNVKGKQKPTNIAFPLNLAYSFTFSFFDDCGAM